MKTRIILISVAVLITFSLKAQEFQQLNVSPLSSIHFNSYPTEFNGKLYFSNGEELWVTDGSQQGTFLLKDINPTGNSKPNLLTPYQGKLYFMAEEDIYGTELWVTDGTQDGTNIFLDLMPGPNGIGVSGDIKVCNDKMYIRAVYSGYGLEPWISDGTEEGTHIIKDINPGLGSSYISVFTEYNEKMYFSATADDINSDYELWVTDGTEIGTYMLKNINSLFDSNPIQFTVYNNKLYFSAISDNDGYELWVTDGTELGTQMVKNINSVSGSVAGNTGFTVYNGKLYFQANDGINGSELWVTDGTEIGTQMIKDINPNGDSILRYFIVYNNKLYFSADDGTNGFELWETDGTTEGTHKLVPNVATNSNPLGFSPEFKVFQDDLYFFANYNSQGRELWKLTTENLKTNIEEKDIFRFYPNPVQNVLNILSQEVIYNVTIYDLSGKMVYQNSFEQKQINLNTQNLRQGLYIVKIATDSQVKTIKINKS